MDLVKLKERSITLRNAASKAAKRGDWKASRLIREEQRATDRLKHKCQSRK